MQSKRLSRILTSVVFLLVSTITTSPGNGVGVGVGVGVSFGTGDLAWGEGKPPAKSGGRPDKPEGRDRGSEGVGYGWGYPPDYEAERQNQAARDADAADRAERAIERASCDADKKALDESLAKCKGKCLADMRRCNDSASGGAYVLGELLSAWAGPDFGSTLENTQCDLTPEQWATDKKTLEKEIEESEKNIAKLNKDIVDNEDKYKTLIKELNEKVPAEKKAKKEKDRDLDEKMRVQKEKLLAQQNSVNESVQRVVEEQKELRKEIANMYASSRSKMMAMSDNAINAECNSNARSFKKKHYNAAGGVTYSDKGAAISHGSSKKNAVTARYEDCRAELFQQRRDNLEAAQREIASKVDTLNGKNEKIVELQNTSALLIKNMHEAAAEMKEMKADLESDFVEFQARLQKEAYDALDSKNKAEANLKKEITIEQKRQREKKTRLNSLGAQRPKTSGGKRDSTISSNFDDYYGALNKLTDFTTRCCKLEGYVRKIGPDGKPYPPDKQPKAPLPFMSSVYCKEGNAEAMIQEAESIRSSSEP